MQEEWATEVDDLKMAEEIVNKHLERNEGEPLGFFEIIVEDEETSHCELSDWLVELAEQYDELYGEEQALYVMKRVIGCYMLAGSTIH